MGTCVPRCTRADPACAPGTGQDPAARSSSGPRRWSTKRRSASAVSVRWTPGMARTCSVIRQRSSASRATTSTSRSTTPDSPVTSMTSGMSASASLTSARLRCMTVTVMYAPRRYPSASGRIRRSSGARTSLLSSLDNRAWTVLRARPSRWDRAITLARGSSARARSSRASVASTSGMLLSLTCEDVLLVTVLRNHFEGSCADRMRGGVVAPPGCRVRMCEWHHTPVPTRPAPRGTAGDPGSSGRRDASSVTALHQATEVVDPVPGAGAPHLPQQPDLIQLLTPEGERVEHPDYSLDISDDELRGLYRDLALVRRWDVEATALQRQGELGIWASLLGQEAAQVGAGRAMAPADMAFPTYREHGVAWARGVDPLHVMGLFRGVDNGGWNPVERGFNLYTIV